MNELSADDVNFPYGSRFGLLWPILNIIYDLNLEFINSLKAIEQRNSFLKKYKIGICDIIESCKREKINASDLGMLNIKLRNLVQILEDHKTINTLLFMGGNSKNGPEYLFRKLIKKHDLELEFLDNGSPKIHVFKMKERSIKTISLISPSNAANRSIGANPEYKRLKMENKNYTTLDFRLNQYRKYFD